MHRIDIHFKPSRLFITGLAVSVACCTLIAVTLPLAFFFRLLIASAGLAYGWLVLQHWVLLRGRHSITRLSHDSAGWELTDNTSTWPAEICGDSTLTPFLAILRFKPAARRKKRTCLVFKDALDPDVYRRLLVTVRTAKIH